MGNQACGTGRMPRQTPEQLAAQLAASYINEHAAGHSLPVRTAMEAIASELSARSVGRMSELAETAEAMLACLSEMRDELADYASQYDTQIQRVIECMHAQIVESEAVLLRLGVITPESEVHS